MHYIFNRIRQLHQCGIMMYLERKAWPKWRTTKTVKTGATPLTFWHTQGIFYSVGALTVVATLVLFVELVTQS